ncbi:MAG: hypothetical protein HZA53_18125 [Planctomycetes bacterium]|nr:hypothetical protein [Planctomycetota bacterium]
MDHSEGYLFLEDYGARVGYTQALVSEMRAYAALSANGSISAEFRAFLATQLAERRAVYQALVEGAIWRGFPYLDGSVGLIGIQQTLPNTQYVLVFIQDMTEATLGIDNIDISYDAGASAALEDLDGAVDTLLIVQGNIAVARFQLGF